MEVSQNSDPEIRKELKNIDCAIITVGSAEQHGPHLPISTDSIIVDYIAKEFSKKKKMLVLPSIEYGISFEHQPMFNISLGCETLLNLLCDISNSISKNGIKSILILNGHHGNSGIIQYVSQKVNSNLQKHMNIFPINYWNLLRYDFDHAGLVETSLMLAIRPDLVRMDNAVSCEKDLSNSRVFYSSITSNPGSFPKITGNGVWGDPVKSSARFGRELLDEILKNFDILLIDLLKY